MKKMLSRKRNTFGTLFLILCIIFFFTNNSNLYSWGYTPPDQDHDGIPDGDDPDYNNPDTGDDSDEDEGSGDDDDDDNNDEEEEQPTPEELRKLCPVAAATSSPTV
ncbi:MAG: hypothetical protein U5P10_00215 [Spirochaetia bacterium]|nr:hypothetical protein [Spirochaetia bacterium]